MGPATQLPVPRAVPAAPVEFCQLTRTTPTLSTALPRREIVASEVETMVDAGQVMVKPGGVVSLEGVGAGDGGLAGGAAGGGAGGGGDAGGDRGSGPGGGFKGGATSCGSLAPYRLCAPAMSSAESCTPKR